MRLFKDVKVELKATMNIDIIYNLNCPCKIKKYNGKTKVESVQMPYNSRAEFEKTIQFIRDLNLIEESDCVEVTKEEITDYHADWNNTGIKEIDRFNGIASIVYNASYKYDVNLIVYGRLYIGNGANFEDCFETKSGIKLDEIINTEAITKLIASKLPEEKFDKEVIVEYKYEDDVRLLPNNDEFREAIYANKDEIFNAIDDDLSYKMYGNSEEE